MLDPPAALGNTFDGFGTCGVHTGDQLQADIAVRQAQALSKAEGELGDW